MIDLTLDEFIDLLKDWDTSSKEGTLVFSDWLLENGQTKWANIVRWVVNDTRYYYPIKDWIVGWGTFKTEKIYKDWHELARREEWPVINW